MANELDPDALAALEEQRDFLLRSLDDLEREREAGDVDAADYEALRDDYTARAGAVLRAIESGRARFATNRRSTSLGRRLAAAGFVLALAVVAGVLVAQSSGERGPGDTATGNLRETVGEQLVEAGSLLTAGETDDAVRAYDEALELAPNNREAMTYRGWALFLDEDPESKQAGLLALLQAAKEHPDYPDVHAFLAVALAAFDRPESALAELDRLDALDPPPDVRQLADGLRARLSQELAATSTTTSTTRR